MRRIIGNIENGRVLISEDKKHHLKVLHINFGEQIELITPDGVFLIEISSINPIDFKIIKKVEYGRELDIDITLFFPLIKPANLEWGIEKAVELGVNKINFFTCKRTSEKINKELFNKRKERYQKIIDNACEQSNRDHTVIIGDLYDIKDIYNLPFDYKFVPYEKDSLKGNLLSNELKFETGKTLSLIVGPEGGFEEEEIKLLEKASYITFSLGKRILRAETAVITALSLISYIAEGKNV